jgi:hypothetical protein
MGLMVFPVTDSNQAGKVHIVQMSQKIHETGAVTGLGSTKRKAPETLIFRGFLLVAGCGLEPQT